MKNAIKLILFFLAIGLTVYGSDQFIVASSKLNIRDGAGTQYDVLLSLAKGDVVKLIEKVDSEWWYVDYDNTQGYVYSKYLTKDPNDEWSIKNYQSGVTPDCENINPRYDYKIDNYLKIEVGSNTDVVIKLMKNNSYDDDECIRIVYIRSNDVYYLKNIPEGQYYLKVAYGKDYRQKVVDNRCYSKFMKNGIYEKGSDILNFNITHLSDRDQIPYFELYLDVRSSVRANSFDTNKISEAEFNK